MSRRQFEARVLKAAREARAQRQAEMDSARRRIDELEKENLLLIRDPTERVAKRRNLDDARREYERLDFVWNDHAPSHSARLAAINLANREFWTQR